MLIIAGCGDGASGKQGGSGNNKKDDCGCNTSFEVCYQDTCYDQTLCANPCPDNEICMDGACMLCTESGQCFATGNESISTVRCDFGYGDCAGNAKCKTRLLSDTAKVVDDEGNTSILLDPAFFHISSNTGVALVRDADGDGYATLDRPSSAGQGHVMLSSKDTLICCSNAKNLCYTADADWKTTQTPENGYIEFAKSANLSDVMKYDANDNDHQIHPGAEDVCDGIDNDGSTVLLKSGELYSSCARYCLDHTDECKTLKNPDGTYKINSVCDAAPDGLDDPYKLIDPKTSQSYTGGDICILRNPSGEVCSTNAVVVCTDVDGNWRLKCENVQGNGVSDGLENGEPSFNGLDDDCDGRVDEDGWVPCVITNSQFSWSLIKDGVTDTRDYKIYQTATGYELPKNEDGSLNLCRIGVLQATPDLTRICKPLYSPREFDYYGDGVDSNCDGADYDMVHARFVAKSSQGDGQASNDDGRYCKYGSDNAVLPCSTLNRAIEQAKDSYGFYQDILVENSTFQIKMQYKDNSHPYPSPITLPNYGTISDSDHFTVPAPASSVNTSYIHNGHIISAYGLHHYLITQKQDSSDFNANNYLFSYEKETENSVTHKKEYTIAEGSEKSRPDEVIRIYGGFKRITAEECTLPTACDYWKKSGTTTIQWLVTPESNTSAYSMIGPSKTGELSPLSLKLANLDLEMSADNNVSSSFELADGVTFIGINGSQSSNILTLDNTTLSVKGINGYSFDTDSSRSKSPVSGMDAGLRMFSSVLDFTIYFVGCSPIDSNNSACSQTNTFVNHYNDNNLFARLSKGRLCGYGRKPRSQLPSFGGMGGWGKTVNSQVSICKDDHCKGKPGTLPSYVDYQSPNSEVVIREEYSSLVGRGGTYLYTNGNMSGVSGCVKSQKAQWGYPGKGGKAGANGKKDDIIMSFAVDTNNGLHVISDRSEGQGLYGDPGAGGGGGNVGYIWPSTHIEQYGQYVRAASGSPGGCGGEGGLAGGTGGSALGIVLSSTPDNANNTVLNILNKRTPVVKVFNGNGGRAQVGADGGKGYGAMDSWAYYGAYGQINTAGGGGAGGGGGGGGIGAGGRPGWAYPYILLCHSDKPVADFDASHLTNVSACKFSISTDMARYAGTRGYGEQNMTGKGYKDVPDSDLGKGGDGTPVQDECIRSACQSTNVWEYGGAGGSVPASQISELQSSSDTYVDDTSCSIGVNHDPIIVKPLIYNPVDGKITD